MAKPGVKVTISVGGKRKVFSSVEAVAKHFKIPYGVLYQRLYVMGWNASDAVTTPVRKMKKRKAKAKKRI